LKEAAGRCDEYLDSNVFGAALEQGEAFEYAGVLAQIYYR
jgi:hypothetical protein